MLTGVDRILVAVRDAAKAAETFGALLGAEVRRESESRTLGARRWTLAFGESEVELLEPAGTGPVSTFTERWGDGLFAAGFATAEGTALAGRLASRGVRFTEEGGQLHLPPEALDGMRIVISPEERRSGPGPVGHLYEVTKMTAHWRTSADGIADLFDLDPARFSPITSEAFGYTGSLLLFDPPARLDRIELAQVTDPASAMGRFVARRGTSLYMCFVETDAPDAIVERLEQRGARWTDAPGDQNAEHLFIHPASLHGILMGVSRTNLAWMWSGRPDLS
jgi:catechol 2,3-dioxygenase-like lactoylglutathione lyase family enzyme